MDLGSRRPAKIEAAPYLADIAKQLEPFDGSDGLAIIVRDASGPVSSATFIPRESSTGQLRSRFGLLLKHGPFGKPLRTFPDHALEHRKHDNPVFEVP
ncbi:hypothetical protein ABIG06_000698 [Bradyrhizobium sp. USDA 326]|uniref:hypothetical protein n=1 Tax=unclassified Bradyrhizobium TaxID=2631580 RepID=UPI0018F490A9|nr:hypothetical protein [Bradyrhizobium sp. RP6]